MVAQTRTPSRQTGIGACSLKPHEHAGEAVGRAGDEERRIADETEGGVVEDFATGPVAVPGFDGPVLIGDLLQNVGAVGGGGNYAVGPGD